MKFVIQRVTHAKVEVEQKIIGSIQNGYLVLIGIAEDDNEEIADKLVITKATAKAHVHSILQKLCVSSRTQATVTAMKEGLV